MSITYCECVFVALDIQHVMRIRHIVNCCLPGSTIFYHIIYYTARFSGKKIIEHKMCILVFLPVLSETFLVLSRIQRDVIKVLGLQVKCPLLSYFSKTCKFFRQIFEKYSNIKFHEIPSSGSRVVPCGRTDRHDEAKQALFAVLRTRLKHVKIQF
jgi:hypothetical protein